MIVSLAVFSVVITIAVGALLVLVKTNDQLQGEQSVMTNLSFALDSMTREIRTGTKYYCDAAANYSAGGPNNIFDDGNNLDTILDLDDVRDCVNGRTPPSHNLQGVAFIEGGESITGGADERILYFFDNTDSTDPKRIYRRFGTRSPEPITSDDIHIQKLEFFVSGSAPESSSEVNQPMVTIVVEAVESKFRNDANPKVYRLQTTITQRTLDI